MIEIQRYYYDNDWGMDKDEAGEYVKYDDHAAIVAKLEADLAEAKKVISVVDGLVTAKGRYHTAQWYQKMVTALDEYKATIKEQQ